MFRTNYGVLSYMRLDYGIPSDTSAVRNNKNTDAQGNPIDQNGKYIVEQVEGIDDLTDEDFTAPRRTVQLPAIPKYLSDALDITGKPVILKMNVFCKNRDGHTELTTGMSRDVLKRALYAPDLCANVKPISRPDYRVTIQTGKKNAIVVMDTYQNNDNVEIVGWRQVDEDGLEKMKKQARREDGQFLILSPINGLAADLSALQTGLSSTCKDTEKT